MQAGAPQIHTILYNAYTSYIWTESADATPSSILPLFSAHLSLSLSTRLFFVAVPAAAESIEKTGGLHCSPYLAPVKRTGAFKIMAIAFHGTAERNTVVAF